MKNDRAKRAAYTAFLVAGALLLACVPQAWSQSSTSTVLGTVVWMLTAYTTCNPGLLTLRPDALVTLPPWARTFARQYEP